MAKHLLELLWEESRPACCVLVCKIGGRLIGCTECVPGQLLLCCGAAVQISTTNTEAAWLLDASVTAAKNDVVSVIMATGVA